MAKFRILSDASGFRKLPRPSVRIIGSCGRKMDGGILLGKRLKYPKRGWPIQDRVSFIWLPRKSVDIRGWRIRKAGDGKMLGERRAIGLNWGN